MSTIDILTSVKLALVTTIFSLISSALAAQTSVYPIHDCAQPSFGTDINGCSDHQSWWDREANAGNGKHWANCPWNAAAIACWNQSKLIWACPVSSRDPNHTISTGDIMKLHNWLAGIFRLAHANGDWRGQPVASNVWEYLNGATLLPLDLGVAKRNDIEAALARLAPSDIIAMAKVLLKYSSVYDTEQWFKYVETRMPGCSVHPTTSLRFDEVRKQFSALKP